MRETPFFLYKTNTPFGFIQYFYFFTPLIHEVGVIKQSFICISTGIDWAKEILDSQVSPELRDFFYTKYD
ncbi:MAG: hypothetical protein CK532_02245 [Flavobacteriales bacterium]|nr:MAG: hypothetical protein CK532_02245 [Flavobacteriales bacterium]